MKRYIALERITNDIELKELVLKVDGDNYKLLKVNYLPVDNKELLQRAINIYTSEWNELHRIA